jgi:hypothetical protein
MKMDQIAYFCYSEKAESKLKRTLCLIDGWIEDYVICDNMIYPLNGVQYVSRAVGRLQFNYNLGVELEILRYDSGSSWHNHLPTKMALQSTFLPIISHIGIHLDDNENFPDMGNMIELGWRLVQQTKTLSHSNPYIVEKKRTYEYQIWETIPGTYLKYIKRIHKV